MPAKFELKKGKGKQFVFSLKSANGEIVLASEQYTTKTGAKNGIESVRKNAALEVRFERKTAKNGKFYFVLKAANYQVIGKSEMYESKAALEKGIAAVKKIASGAKIADEA
jgi:uncharacterized protein